MDTEAFEFGDGRGMVRICRNCDGYADGAAGEPDSRGSGVAIECPENRDGYSVATVWFCLFKLLNPRPNVGFDSPNFLDLGWASGSGPVQVPTGSSSFFLPTHESHSNFCTPQRYSHICCLFEQFDAITILETTISKHFALIFRFFRS